MLAFLVFTLILMIFADVQDEASGWNVPVGQLLVLLGKHFA
jgi:hypothetical protein